MRRLLLLLVLAAACDDSASTVSMADATYVPGTARLAVRLEPALRSALATTALVRAPYHLVGTGDALTAPDGTAIVASCGATFIAPHVAVTAAHCVDGSAVRGTPVEVSFLDVTDDVRWQKASILEGTFPAWTHPRLASSDGYVVHVQQCRVAISCYGRPLAPALSPGCPIEELPADGADVALLRCDDDLPPGHGWSAIADAVAPGDAIAHPWAYELYDLQASRVDRAELDAHYVLLDTGRPELSFHYYAGGTSQPLPLIDAPFLVDGKTVPHAIVSADERSVVTDGFGCHGTSGSGLFRRSSATGEYELVGPAVTVANEGIVNGRLCMTSAHVAPGVASLVFTPPAEVRALLAHVP